MNQEFEKGFKECVKYLNIIEDDLFNEIFGSVNDVDKIFIAFENDIKTLEQWIENGGRNI